MKLYIPFNMIVDIDFGIIRLMEKVTGLPEYSVNKLKSFLLKRSNENPILEYCELRNTNIIDNAYDIIMEKFYSSVLRLSNLTDILSFVINTHKLGFANELEITVGCNTEEEIEYFKSILSSLKYNVNTDLNSNIKLDDYDYVFVKRLDEYYINYLINNKISGKRLYVADYSFNTIVDPETKTIIIDPILHMALESEGFVVNTISIYNKK